MTTQKFQKHLTKFFQIHGLDTTKRLIQEMRATAMQSQFIVEKELFKKKDWATYDDTKLFFKEVKKYHTKLVQKIRFLQELTNQEIQ